MANITAAADIYDGLNLKNLTSFSWNLHISNDISYKISFKSSLNSLKNLSSDGIGVGKLKSNPNFVNI